MHIIVCGSNNTNTEKMFACRVVRLTSPNLNYFIIAGSYIMYASIFIRLIPSVDQTVNEVICNVSCDQLPTLLLKSLILVTKLCKQCFH